MKKKLTIVNKGSLCLSVLSGWEEFRGGAGGVALGILILKLHGTDN